MYLFVIRLVYYFRLSFLIFLKPFIQYFGVRATNEGCWKCPQMFFRETRGMGPRWGGKGSCYLTVCVKATGRLNVNVTRLFFSDKFQAFVNGSELLVPGNAPESEFCNS